MGNVRGVKEAVVLVAGVGSRLKPLTDDMPKCLIDVEGEPMVVRFLRQLKGCGVERVTLVTGYREERLREALLQWEELPELHMVTNRDYARFNNSESVRVGLGAILEGRSVGPGESVLIADGDVLLKDDELIRGLVARGGENVLAVEVGRELGEEEMKVTVDELGGVTSIGKGLEPQASHGESMGVQLMGGSYVRRFMEEMEVLNGEEKKVLYYEDVFGRSLLEEVGRFQVLEVTPGAFIEIDTIEDLEEARRLVATWS